MGHRPPPLQQFISLSHLHGEVVLDTLFDQPQAVKAIAEMRREVPVPGLGRIGATIRTQNRILQAAGIDHDGAALVLRQLGLAALYNQVFMIWLEDDDPGMARTMAALDRRLRQGERTLGFLDDIVDRYIAEAQAGN